MEFRKRQIEAIEAAKAGHNIFLTGKAGTGKSTVLTTVMDIFREMGRKFIACAPTGIAANNIGGVTLHSMFALSPWGILTDKDCNHLRSSKRDVLRKADVYIFDEISMLRPDILDAVHFTLRKNGLPGLDKKQLIFTGDLKQLPVILEDNARSVLYQSYGGDQFLDAQIFNKIQLCTIELDEIVRQNDQEFIENLNLIRDDQRRVPYFRQFIHDEPKGIILAPHNATVQEYNEAGLNRLEGQLYTFEAIVTGTAKPEDFNLEKTVNVREGAKIMYLVNSKENPLRNGTLGTFTTREEMVEDESGKKVKKRVYFIKVGNVDYALEPAISTKKEYVYVRKSDALELTELGTIIQYPIKLAYALSIHKAQGLTFDEVTIDLRKPCFQKGQMYVAFSRVRTPEGLRIIV
jgi:ATP-dependent DNA helicase PIF1